MSWVHRFEFFTPNGALAASIHRPVDNMITVTPAVVVTGSWLTVKEQMPDLYAARLADLGYTAITFDFAGFGASGGAPRQAEIPLKKVADIAAVVREVSALSFVNRDAVGLLAVCASAQYALRTIAEGAPVSAFASVAGWFHDTESVAVYYGGTDGVTDRLRRAEDAVAEYQRTGTVRLVPAYRQDDERAAMFLPLDYYADPTRGAVPEWTNEMAEMSWQYWLTFNGLAAASDISLPTLFVHSDDCVLPANVKRLASIIKGSEVVWGEGPQIDFYDQDQQVSFAMDAVHRHFRSYLGPATTTPETST